MNARRMVPTVTAQTPTKATVMWVGPPDRLVLGPIVRGELYSIMEAIGRIDGRVSIRQRLVKDLS